MFANQNLIWSHHARGPDKKVLNFLISHGFIKELIVGDSKKYGATKWGLEYLETFKRMRKFFAALEK